MVNGSPLDYSAQHHSDLNDSPRGDLWETRFAARLRVKDRSPQRKNILQVLAGWNTAKRLNTVAQGRREAAHPGIGSKANLYAEGVIQLILGMDLFNPLGLA